MGVRIGVVLPAYTSSHVSEKMPTNAAMDHAPLERRAEFRFYEELNDFLPADRRKRSFTYLFHGTPAVKDAIEAIGVPHTEIDLILIDGVSVGFDKQLTGDERVAVYPVFERLDVTPLNHLRPRPLRETRFILDTHLGRLARYLRMLGLDAAYRNDFDDEMIIERARDEGRIILTRDRGILRHGEVTHGYWLRSTDSEEQLREVVEALDLWSAARPFSRCIVCNEELTAVEKEDVEDRIPPSVRAQFDEFSQCPCCRRVYWRGSHYDRMQRLIASLRS